MGRIEVIGKRIAARKTRPGIIQLDAGRDNRQSERRHGRSILVHILPDEVIGNSSSEANRGPPVAEWVPCDSDAGLEVTPMRIHAGLAIEARIAGIGESRRSICD